MRLRGGARGWRAPAPLLPSGSGSASQACTPAPSLTPPSTHPTLAHLCCLQALPHIKVGGGLVNHVDVGCKGGIEN